MLYFTSAGVFGNIFSHDGSYLCDFPQVGDNLRSFRTTLLHHINTIVYQVFIDIDVEFDAIKFDKALDKRRHVTGVLSVQLLVVCAATTAAGGVTHKQYARVKWVMTS